MQRRVERSTERGQSTVLMMGVVAVLMVIAAGLVHLGAEVVERGRLQAVADMAALASVRSVELGREVATRNGAVVVLLDRVTGDGVTVVVERAGRRAVAAAA